MFRKPLVLILLVCYGILAAGIASHASAWVLPEGDKYVSSTFTIYKAKGLFIGDRRTQFIDAPATFGSRELEHYSATLYAEYGLPSASISISIPYTKSEEFNAFGALHGEQSEIGDVKIIYKRLLHEGYFALALSGGVKIAGGYNPLLINSFGEGQTDIITQLSISKFFDNRIYTSVDLGYAFRTGDVSDNPTLFGEVGYSSESGWTPRLFAEGVFGTSGIDIGGPGFVGPSTPNGTPSTDATGFPATRERKIVTGAGLDYRFNQYNIGLTFATIMDGSRNTPDGQSYSLTTGYSF